MAFILGLIGTIIGVALGGYILFVGRHALHITLGIIGIAATADLLAVLVANLDNGLQLIEEQAWVFLAIALVMGVIGFVLGRTKPDIAALVIGFAAGADIALWFYEISTYFITNVANQSRETALYTGIVVLLIGGVLGLLLVRTSRDEALILITMILGTKIIQSALPFSQSSSLTAIIILTFALAGVLVQYTLYLREVKSGEETPSVQASSLAFFQDLDLDL